MYCSSCGKEIAESSSFCPECGVQLTQEPQLLPQEYNREPGTRSLNKNSDLVYPKNPPLSPHLALLGVFTALVGLPHIIFGQVAKGIALSVLFWVSFPTGFGPLIILVASVIDAYKLGYTLKAGKPVKKWEFFPNP
ncbi:MAG: zinc-ribbon domain-containing protein [Cyanobacteriota bacterium]|nr:zinc-ribbon domain-containing protein [Cyanobacteriota bacterium]